VGETKQFSFIDEVWHHRGCVQSLGKEKWVYSLYREIQRATRQRYADVAEGTDASAAYKLIAFISKGALTDDDVTECFSTQAAPLTTWDSEIADYALEHYSNEALKATYIAAFDLLLEALLLALA